MSDAAPFDLLWLIPVLPLTAAVVTGLFGPRYLKENSHWPCILGAAGACLVSLLVFLKIAVGGPGGERAFVCFSDVTWFQAGSVNVSATLRADSLTAVMLMTVTFIGTLIAIYSSGYMHGDEGYPRFFAFVALFLFSMTGLVLADNYVLLYAFWEGVGLCSYMLIGFWFTKPSAAAAARKAFLVTRLGDVGLFLGILLLWAGMRSAAGTPLYALDFQTVFANVAGQDPALITGICLLLFCGAVGKSAQFPLHVWLPDAMEGPSPVSALIHAATMVTAGVYLVARSTPLFAASPSARIVVAGIGAFTALFAGLIAVTQTDLKRVLAYSTVSQLGYMFLALGSGSVVAAIFHLYTHAFFKALLFLAAGSVMHAMGNVIDMRRFGGLRKVLPTTRWTFLVGALALAGVPPLAGFWSKDEILGGAFDSYNHLHHQPSQEVFWLVVLFTGLFTAALTAFYTFRAYFLTFEGEEIIPHEAGHHAHESPPVMTIPLMLLAVGAAFAGFVNIPGVNILSHFLESTQALQLHGGHEDMHWWLMVLSSVLAVGGVGAAYYVYLANRGLAATFADNFALAYHLSLNKFHIDEIYNFFIVKPLWGFAEFCRIFDLYVVDGLVDLFAQIPRLFGLWFRLLQNGLIQFYALSMSLCVAAVLTMMLWLAR